MLTKPTIRVLYVDLASDKVRVEERDDLFHLLGGTGVAAALLEENMKAGADPLDPAQPIVFAIGPMTMIYPVVTKTIATFISPLTGEYGESHAGGRLAYSLRHAGYDALVITGKAAGPAYLSIQDNRIEVRDAGPLWGADVAEAGRLMRGMHASPGHRSIMRIGPAGENGVRYANVNVETYRHFGRLGLGTLFGAKKLKGVLTIGTHHWPIKNARAYRQAYDEIHQRVISTAAMEKYHELGTPVNVNPLNAVGALPTRNLQSTRFEHAPDISGEAFGEHDLMYKRACAGCPIGCIHIALLRQQFGAENEYEIQSSYVSYDYEPIYAFGSMLGIGTRDGALRLMEAADRLGMDAMESGVVLAWATEAMDKGILSEKDLGVRLSFGDANGYFKALHLISEGANETARLLGLGAVQASRHFGAEDLSFTAGGAQGVAGYHTGYANIIGHHVGSRHSHLDNAGYSLDQKQRNLSDEETVDKLIAEECERDFVTSLAICLFARAIYDRETVRKALATIDIQVSDEDIQRTGREIYATKLRIKQRLGYDPTKVKLPKRIFETTSMNGPISPARVDNMLQIYRERCAALLAEFAKT
jgi:aldehyde:ferredoxin oxidoreductase